MEPAAEKIIDGVYNGIWNAAIDEIIRLEKSRAAPDLNRIRDFEAKKRA